MKFSPAEIDMARDLRRLSLPWEPFPGNYVFDETGFCGKQSPFQDQVYFILNYDYFIRQAGGVDRFKEIMVWLPTWSEARQVLRSFGRSDREVASELRSQGAIENNCERLALYGMIAEQLTRASTIST